MSASSTRRLTGESELGGRTSRGATVVLVLAVAGAVAALVVSASIERLQTDTTLSGQGGEGRELDSGESLDQYNRVLPLLEADRVAWILSYHAALNARAGRKRVSLLAFDQVRGNGEDVGTIKGRQPRGSHEIALGPATLEDLHVSVGDRVRLHTDAGSASYRIVGETLFPEGDFSYDQGGALTVAAAERMLGGMSAAEASGVHLIDFDWSDDVNAARADHELKAAGFTLFTSNDANVLSPARVTNLGEVERVPRYLAVFLGLLALVTLGRARDERGVDDHGRRRPCAALGLSRRGSAGILVAVQAATIVVVALAIGVPLGLLLGDRIWTVIAEGAHVIVETIAPAGAIIGFVGAVVVLAAVATIGPAWRTARMRPGEALRWSKVDYRSSSRRLRPASSVTWVWPVRSAPRLIPPPASALVDPTTTPRPGRPRGR